MEEALATMAQREEIVRLLNNDCITRKEKTRFLLNINKMLAAHAARIIAYLKRAIYDRDHKLNTWFLNPITTLPTAPYASITLKLMIEGKTPEGTHNLYMELFDELSRTGGLMAASYSNVAHYLESERLGLENDEPGIH